MPFSKKYFMDAIGEKTFQRLVKYELFMLKNAFRQWVKEEKPARNQRKINYWLENVVALDYDFQNKDGAEFYYDDILYRSKGAMYEHLKLSYEQYREWLFKRFIRRNIPDSLGKMLMWEVWKRLAKTLDFKLYNVL